MVEVHSSGQSLIQGDVSHCDKEDSMARDKPHHMVPLDIASEQEQEILKGASNLDQVSDTYLSHDMY